MKPWGETHDSDWHPNCAYCARLGVPKFHWFSSAPNLSLHFLGTDWGQVLNSPSFPNVRNTHSSGANFDYSNCKYPQPTGPGCQRKTPWCVHTNDPVNLGSGPEFWLQFANAVELGENTVGIFILYISTVVLAEWQILR